MREERGRIPLMFGGAIIERKRNEEAKGKRENTFLMLILKESSWSGKGASRSVYSMVKGEKRTNS